MAKVVFWICVALTFCSQVVFSSVFDSLLNNSDQCTEVCDKTYAVHTYPNSDHVECCKRGCRFYTLIDLSRKQNGDVNATRNVCMSSCAEAYSESSNLYACNVGCSNQVASAPVQNIDDIPKEPSETQILLKPFMYIHNIYSRVVDHVARIVSVTWALYMQPSNGDIFVVQSEPEILTEYIGMDDTEDRPNLPKPWPSSDFSDETNSDSDSLPDIYYYHQKAESSAEKNVPSASDQLPVRITLNTYTNEEVQSIDWLGCVSRKSGLPRWLLGLIIFASAMVMVWLCFATTATAPDQHVRSEPLSVNGDLDTWEVLDDKERLKTSCELPLLHGESAGPLPVKYKLVTA